MALDKLTKLTSQSGITTTIDYQMSDLTVDTITVQSGGLKMPVGMSTFQNVTVTGDLTVNGTTTTLDTDLIGVDKLEVSGNNTTAVGIITQAGSGDILRLYDNTTEVFSVADGGNVTTTGQLNIPDAIVHSGNDNLKIRFPATDTFTVETGGSERLRIASNGHVGVGTDNPQVPFHIFKTQDSILRLESSDNAAVYHEWYRDNAGSKSRIGYLGFGGNGATLNITNEIPNGDIFLSTTPSGASAGAEELAFRVYADKTAQAYGNLLIPDKIIHTGDTNTAIRFPTADTITAETAGDERLRITSAGKVGIGTDDPGVKLDVRGVVNIETDDNNTLNIIDTTASFRPSINFKKNASGTVSTLMQVRAEGTNGLDIKDGSGNRRLRITPAGYVGINSTGAYPLDVFEPTNNAGWISISGENTGYDTGFLIRNGTTAKWYLLNDVNGTGSHAFEIRGDGNSSDKFFTITQTGKIGINQDTPTADLEVVPAGTSTTSTLFINTPTHNTNVASEAILKFGYGHSGSPDGVGHIKMVEQAGNSFDADLIFGVPTNNGSGGSVTNEKLRIKADGKIGIGKTNPGELLTLVGNISMGFRGDNVARYIGKGTDTTYHGTIGGTSGNANSSWIGFESNNGTGYEDKITFGTHKSGSSGGERMRIDGLGNVGINCTDPDSRLEIRSTAGSYTPVLKISNHHAGAYAGAIKFESKYNSTIYETAAIYGYGGSGNTDGILAFQTKGQERLRIDKDGNIKIGDATTDFTYKLTVSGNASVNTGLFMHDGAAGTWFGIQTQAANGLVVLRADARSGAYPPLTFNVGGAERLRIHTKGVLSTDMDDMHGQGHYSRPLLELHSGGTPSQFKITTNIPYSGTTHAHSVRISGFRYGGQQMVDLQIGWHVYNNTFYNRVASSSGGWAPTITLAVENNKVVIHLTSPGYWPKMYVESLYQAFGDSDQAKDWSWSDAAISADSGTPNETVPYKSAFGNGVAIGTDGALYVNNGNIIMNNDKGISFINADDTATGETVSSSILDDYEEGSFTASLKGHTDPSNTSSTNANRTKTTTGYYVKVGRNVTVTMRWYNLQENGADDMHSCQLQNIHGLPYHSGNFSTNWSASIGYQRGLYPRWAGSSVTSQAVYMYGYIEGNSDKVQLRCSQTSGPGTLYPTVHDSTTHMYMTFTISYETYA